jgi:hypothetical protein
VWGFNYVLYSYPYGWQMGLDAAGSQDAAKVSPLFLGRRWHELVPDQAHALVTAGYGTFGATDYVTAARTASGALAMAYLPSTGTGSRSVTVNMAELAGPTTARWYNPTTGTYAAVSGSPFPNTGSRVFASPGNNGAGANDWVLVLEAP